MDDPKDDAPADRPVLNGLVALVAVALGVGLVLALVAVAGSNVLGLSGDGDSTSADSSAGDSMFIPSEFESTGDGGPRLTLNTADPDESTATAGPDEAEESETTEATESESARAKKISLQAEQTAVSSGERIYFSGVYPGGEGAILWVQRRQGGEWADFPASLGVSNETFRSYVFTGQEGVHRFRVIDRDTGKASNEIRVRVG